jgi:hypothetical protein
LYHPSAGQIYFYLGILPIGALLAVWLLAVTRTAWPVPVAAALAGMVAEVMVPSMGRPAATRDGWMFALAESAARVFAFGALAALLALGVAAWLRQRPGTDPPRPVGGRRAAVAAAGLTAALLGASVAGGVGRTIEYGLEGRYEPRSFDRLLPLPADRRWPMVTRAEMQAALWLDGHAADEDVVATNVHCQPPKTVPNCDARAFWVAGLGGHRILIESWAYTDEAVAAHGRGGLTYPRQPAPDQVRYALNERVFRAPTAADLDRLRSEYGVRWLLADHRAGLVSPKLRELAEVRLISGPVIVFELR